MKLPKRDKTKKFRVPIRTAEGEIFYSTAEMLQSRNSHVRGLARSFIRHREEFDKIIANVLNNNTAYDRSLWFWAV